MTFRWEQSPACHTDSRSIVCSMVSENFIRFSSNCNLLYRLITFKESAFTSYLNNPALDCALGSISKHSKIQGMLSISKTMSFTLLYQFKSSLSTEYCRLILCSKNKPLAAVLVSMAAFATSKSPRIFSSKLESHASLYAVAWTYKMYKGCGRYRAVSCCTRLASSGMFMYSCTGWVA